MIVKCSNCGKEICDHFAWKVNTGRTQWLCNECYQAGQREAHLQEINRAIRTAKIFEEKKKHEPGAGNQ